MDTNDLVKLLPPGCEQACFDKKAVTGKRTIKNPLDLLRLILFYLSGNKSLMEGDKTDVIYNFYDDTAQSGGNVR